MIAGGDLHRPAPPASVARDLAVAPGYEGHRRTGGTVFVTVPDRTRASVAVPPQPIRDDARRVAEVTGRLPAAAAWLGGARFGPEHPGDRAARDAGVRFSVSGLGHERLTR